MTVRLKVALLALGWARFRWVRAWVGGHWEYWWVEAPVAASMWLSMPTCIHQGGARPGLCHGTPICEDYGPVAL